ncbi:MAG: putative DNA binding domain-containing protein, partial [Bacillales bacterium]|nr:putative DNA binding domain-containing protein [Bacillales bacterium]
MKLDDIKREALKIIENGQAESDCIEYKKSSFQADKIIKTICAFANNYMKRNLSLLFIGIEELDGDDGKAIPKRSICGFDEGQIENIENSIKSLIPFIHPKVKYNLVSASIDNRYFIVVAVEPQTGGPFETTEKALTDKSIKLKPGMYVRVSKESRLATPSEKFDLLKDFVGYHFSSLVSDKATLDDLSIDYIKEYLAKTSLKSNTSKLSKIEIAEALKLIDPNDVNKNRVTNYAVLMFSEQPNLFIPYSFLEVIRNSKGSEKRMESKTFIGPIWRQVYAVLKYIDETVLNTLTIREDNKLESRKVANYPYITCEELITNAIVHKNYENPQSIQIYIQEKEIIIVNYNKPLPPISITDLNTKTLFPNRRYENPEIREMFKLLDLIESY